MVRVRLKRTGTRNAICFRVVVMDQRAARDGKAIEELGFYNPRSKEEKIKLDRVDYWKSVGAVFSETVEDIVERVRAGKRRTSSASPPCPKRPKLKPPPKPKPRLKPKLKLKPLPKPPPLKPKTPPRRDGAGSNVWKID